jgi:UDP-glucose:(heptosyl)LPS alpha-1,3-glucosyltransferase
MTQHRIAVVSPFLDKRHGTERAMVECISRLAGDYEFHIYSNRVEDLDLTRIVWHRVPALPGPHLFAFLWWCVANTFWRWRDRRFRHLAPEIVFSPGVNCLDADAIVVHIVFREFYRLMREELRLRRVPFWSWPRAIHRRLYYRLIIALERRVYSNPRVRLAAVSQFTAAQLHSCFARSDVAVIPNAIDHELFYPGVRLSRRAAERAKFHYSDSDLVLLLMGNDWKKKGLRYLLEATALCEDPSLRLLIVGSDDQRPYRLLAETLGVYDRLRFSDVSADVMQFYAAADAYVGPSIEDSFGLPTAECMACGLPVITSRNTGVSGFVSHEKDGFVLEDPTDAKALAAIIQALSSDSELRQRIGDAAARASRILTWENNAASIREWLEQTRRRRLHE